MCVGFGLDRDADSRGAYGSKEVPFLRTGEVDRGLEGDESFRPTGRGYFGSSLERKLGRGFGEEQATACGGNVDLRGAAVEFV